MPRQIRHGGKNAKRRRARVAAGETPLPEGSGRASLDSPRESIRHREQCRQSLGDNFSPASYPDNGDISLVRYGGNDAVGQIGERVRNLLLVHYYFHNLSGTPKQHFLG